MPSIYCVYIGFLSFSQRNDLAKVGAGEATVRLELFESMLANISRFKYLTSSFGDMNRGRQDNELNGSCTAKSNTTNAVKGYFYNHSVSIQDHSHTIGFAVLYIGNF